MNNKEIDVHFFLHDINKIFVYAIKTAAVRKDWKRHHLVGYKNKLGRSWNKLLFCD